MEKPESETPRTDRFVEEHEPLRLPIALAADTDTMLAIRQLMIDWATHARDLEREVAASVPVEWVGSKPQLARLDAEAAARKEWEVANGVPMTIHERALFHFAFDMGAGKV